MPTQWNRNAATLQGRSGLSPRASRWTPRLGLRTIAPVLLCLALSWTAYAGQSEAEAAVARILFETDMENTSFSVRPDGFVDILFGAAVSDADYIRIVEKMRSDPDIKGVLAGKAVGNFCAVK